MITAMLTLSSTVQLSWKDKRYRELRYRLRNWTQQTLCLSGFISFNCLRRELHGAPCNYPGETETSCAGSLPRGGHTAGKATVDRARHQEPQITGVTEGRGHHEFQLLFQQCRQNTFRETLRVKIFNSTVDNVVFRYCFLCQMNT